MDRNSRPTSADLYSWFQEFLEKKGGDDSYSYSIGRWKRECATEEEIHEWEEFEWHSRIGFAINEAAKKGVKLTIDEVHP